ncbi:MAG: cytidylate [Beijerinckiaceae bacterium]|nr:MAG: cytidylate [Beijerinckiaceae bacterium]
MSRPLIIAVDGPALLYRAVGQKMRDAGHDLDDETAATAIARRFDASWLDDERLRERLAGEAASRVAKMTPVREALRKFQQDFAHQPGGAVLDGRDIGTVIAPDAPAKLWIDADVAVRANRRFRELTGRGEAVSEADILADLVARDARDAPNMVIATDAVRIDTTALGIEEAVAAALAAVLAMSKARACKT